MTTTIVPSHSMRGGYHKIQDAREDAARGIKYGDPFRNNGGSFRGEGFNNVAGVFIGSGRMPEELRAELRRARFVRYVITSYATPIAWLAWDDVRSEFRWHMPSKRYSSTTSRHQSQAQWIIMSSGFPLAND